MHRRIESAMTMLTEPRHFKLRLFIEGNIIGVATGLVIALFRYLLELSEEALPVLYRWLPEHIIWIPVWFAVLSVCAYILYRIVKKDGMTSGSGIPQIKGILLGEMDMSWARVLVLKFTGAVLGIGAGMSLGREGPSVQLGACLGQGLGRLTHRSYAESHYLLTAGAGAGLAAAFNAPLAGVIFCLEELTKNFSSFVLMGAISAAVTATTVTQYFFGMEPVFHMGVVPVFDTGHMYLQLIALGAFVGLLGLAFNPMLTRSQDFYKKLPAKARPLLPLFCAGLVGFILPQILGGGSRLVDSLVVTNYTLLFLIVLLLGKFFFTMICFGSGVPGGIFLPMLVLGSVGGAIFAKIVIFLGIMPELFAVNCIVFGMAAYFSAVVKSPITGSVLIMEMTGSFEHMLALIIVSMTAYLVADLTGGEPVYDMLLSRSLAVRKKIASRIRHRRILMELSVGVNSALADATIAEISWPSAAVIVNVRRGAEELPPKEDLRLQAGDNLFILTDTGDTAALQNLAAEHPE
ncbi:ClC family H(+)/Cl(-) exchange transporter [Mitsuokella sp.]|uniref:ClC family H(+)/Cl(-) exchange transporter n=1 Tax=unclassified Mitsuokella TaxID=2637239 RepID=UPI003D7DB42C